MIVELTASAHEVACQMLRRIASSNKAQFTLAFGANSLWQQDSR